MYYKNITWNNWSLEDLAHNIGDLDYDATVELFSILADQFIDKRNLNEEEIQCKVIQKTIKQIWEKLRTTIEDEIIPLADKCREHNEISKYHNKSVEGYSHSLDTLWQNIRRLEYYILYDLFHLLAQKFKEDSIADNGRWRPRIANWINNIWISFENIANENIVGLLSEDVTR